MSSKPAAAHFMEGAFLGTIVSVWDEIIYARVEKYDYLYFWQKLKTIEEDYGYKLADINPAHHGDKIVLVFKPVGAEVSLMKGMGNKETPHTL